MCSIMCIMRKRNLLNQGFGRLRVISAAKNIGRLTAWNCVCDCGKKTRVRSQDLVRGYTKSCGCLRVELARKHGYAARWNGKAPSREYSAWSGMKYRCLYPNNAAFRNYGGRGITVCAEWKNDFVRFLKDMGRCPKGRSLDRINNDGNYEPNNCRWATRKQQNNNRRPETIVCPGCGLRFRRSNKHLKR